MVRLTCGSILTRGSTLKPVHNFKIDNSSFKAKIRTLQTPKVSGTQAGFNRALSELWCRAEGLATRQM
jgi:hypothetical protein